MKHLLAASLLPILALSLGLGACADPGADSKDDATPGNGDNADNAESAESDVTGASAASASSLLEPGKYVSRGRILMIYGACSRENFLGEDAAKGAIDKGVMRAPEGNVCGGYKLTSKSAGVVEVTWRYDQKASAHRDAEIAKFCRASEGTYEMTESSAYRDPKPGTYVLGKNTLVISKSCSVPSHLGDDSDEYAAQAPIEPEFINGKPTAILPAIEGNVCSKYAIEPLANDAKGKVKITWVRAADASASLDPSVIKSCKDAEGVYTPR